MQLKHKKAVITGGSSGIGAAVARAFAGAGAELVITYARAAAAAQSVASEINAAGGRATTIAADVCSETDVEALTGQALDTLGGIDIWANIAGADILTGEAATWSDEAKLNALIEVDLRGTIRCCWAAAAAMSESGGAILNTSWDLALVGMAERNPEMFAATKAGITGFTRSLARSLAPNIRVNEVAPGWIKTAFAETEMAPEYRDEVIRQTPLARFGTPQDVARAALFLCSDEAAFITGQTLKVNGGLSS